MENYKEKLRLAKEALDSGSYDKETIEYIFPELKEIGVQDEKIRKDLITFLDDIWHLGKNANFDRWGKADCSDWIAWLEKQGKSKEDTTRYKIAKYLKNLIIDQSRRGTPMLNYEGRIEEEVDFIISIAKKELKKVKQKPAWSEEDEQQMKSCFDFLDNISCGDDSELNDCRNWLKSLKERMKGE